MDLLTQTINRIPKDLNSQAMEEAKKHLDFLLKPQGSLGGIEDLAIHLAGIKGSIKPEFNKKAVLMMCADNGVYEEGFHSYPQEITQLIAQLSGDQGIVGASVISRLMGAMMVTVDVGVKVELNAPHIINKKVRFGTDNIAKGPAMTRGEALRAIEAGIAVTDNLIASGVDLIAVGEAGICNTTTSAAMLAVFTGLEPEKVVGQGTGLTEDSLKQKIDIVKKAIAINQPTSDPLDILHKVGGLEIAGMAGAYLAAASRSVPVVMDGFISGVAALTAIKLAPEAGKFIFPSHKSAEKGVDILLDALDFKPFLTLDMRLGEGTGALLAFNIFECASKIMNEMGTFADLPSNN